MPNDSDSDGGSPPVAPGLTVGQRVLLKLPDLGRNKSARNRTVGAEPEVAEPPRKATSRPGAPKTAKRHRFRDRELLRVRLCHPVTTTGWIT